MNGFIFFEEFGSGIKWFVRMTVGVVNPFLPQALA